VAEPGGKKRKIMIAEAVAAAVVAGDIPQVEEAVQVEMALHRMEEVVLQVAEAAVQGEEDLAQCLVKK
jgi:hypothetical protein